MSAENERRLQKRACSPWGGYVLELHATGDTPEETAQRLAQMRDELIAALQNFDVRARP